MVKKKSPVEDTKTIVAASEEPETQNKKQPFSPEEIERRILEAKALISVQTPEPVLLRNLLDSLKAEDRTLADACESARAKVEQCFGTSKTVGKKAQALRQSITERHFEAGEELERMSWLLRGCYDIWRKSEKLPETTSYRARELFKAAKNIDAVKGMTLREAYKKFGILQPKQPSLHKLLISIEKHIKRVIESGIKSADEGEVSNCSATINRCVSQFEKFAVTITCTSVVKAEATAELAKTAAKKKSKVTEKQLQA